MYTFTPVATVKVTATVRGPAPEAVTFTAPLYVPGASPDGFTETLSAIGVAPPVGLMESHPLPEVVETVALKLSAAPLEETEID
jgi:hypothetical protein